MSFAATDPETQACLTVFAQGLHELGWALGAVRLSAARTSAWGTRRLSYARGDAATYRFHARRTPDLSSWTLRSRARHRSSSLGPDYPHPFNFRIVWSAFYQRRH